MGATRCADGLPPKGNGRNYQCRTHQHRPQRRRQRPVGHHREGRDDESQSCHGQCDRQHTSHPCAHAEGLPCSRSRDACELGRPTGSTGCRQRHRQGWRRDAGRDAGCGMRAVQVPQPPDNCPPSAPQLRRATQRRPRSRLSRQESTGQPAQPAGVDRAAGSADRFDRRDFELERDLVADQKAAGLQCRVPVHAPVLTVDLGAALETGTQVAERIDRGPGELEVH